MLSASSISGNGSYYIDLAHDDYYFEGGEPPGKWLGSGIDLFGFTDKSVNREDFKALIDGFSPAEDRNPLVLNAGNEKRQRGHDFCFSAPKSVSLIWSAADPETRKLVQEAQATAVKSAIQYLEEQATFTRRGKRGELVERAKLMVAAFEHSTSRELDPNLHTHCLIFNSCARFDGTTGTLHGQVRRDNDGRVIDTYNALYRNIHSAGAIYRLELANQLSRNLGLKILQAENGFSFEIEGVPEKAIQEFSKRRTAIEKVLKKLGATSAKTAEAVALETRTTKKNVARSELLKGWRRQLKSHGLTPAFVRSIQSPNPVHKLTKEQLGEEINKVANSLAKDRGSIELKDLYKQAAIALQTKGVSWSDLSKQMEHELSNGKLVSLGVDQTSPVISTIDSLKREFDFRTVVDESKADQSHAINPKLVERVVKHSRPNRRTKLSQEQASAVNYLTSKTDESHAGIRVLTGDAGAGKTTTMKVAKEVWSRAGYQVVGACLSNNAAQTLQAETGIESNTITKWNVEIDKGISEAIKHHAKMLGRTALGKRTWKRSSDFSLDSKTVLVIDEAVMADTRQLLKLVKKARESSSLVVLCGDEKQCQAIGHGGAFSNAANALGSFRLTENWRQKSSQDKEISTLFSQGKAADALRALADAGRIKVRKTVASAVDQLVQDWVKTGSSRPKENLILVGKHEDRLEINKRCQSARVGYITRSISKSLTNHEGQKLLIGDRIHFRESLIVRDGKSREKIARGAFGTIKSLSQTKKTLCVKLDDGRVLTLSSEIERGKNRKLFARQVKSKAQISLGYAVTTHASQGASVDNTFVLATGNMQDKELTYVQATRARHATRFYLIEREAGSELSRLAASNSPKFHAEPVLREKDKAKPKRIGKDSVENSTIAKNMSKSRHKKFALCHSDELYREQTEQDYEERVRLRSK